MSGAIKYLTKHCRPRDREFMLAGHFKLSTLSEIRASEDHRGTQSDKNEGIIEASYKGGDLRGFHLNLGDNIIFNNFNTVGVKVPFAVYRRFDAAIFCTSIGAYCRDRHRRFLDGTPDYEKNPDMNAYLVLDRIKLERACEALLYTTEFDAIGAEPVKYIERYFPIIPSNNQWSLTPEAKGDLARAALIQKPVMFSIEEEFRISLINCRNPYREINSLYTKDQNERIQALFRDAIYEKGGIL